MYNQRTIGPVSLTECWGYAELEQTLKYKSTQCSISCHPYRSTRNKSDPVIKMVKINPRSTFENIWAWRPSWSCDCGPIEQTFVRDYNSFWKKNHCFTFFSYKSKLDQIWHGRKIGQGQLRIIIWTHLVVLEYPMPHTNFQGHWPFGSREEDFLKVFTIYEHVCYIGHVT